MSINLWMSICTYCRENKITTEELADIIGIHQRTMKGIANGNIPPDIKTYITILLKIGKVPIVRIENLKDQK